MHGVQSDGESNGDPNKVEATLACLCFFGQGEAKNSPHLGFLKTLPGERVAPLGAVWFRMFWRETSKFLMCAYRYVILLYIDIKISYRYSFRHVPVTGTVTYYCYTVEYFVRTRTRTPYSFRWESWQQTTSGFGSHLIRARQLLPRSSLSGGRFGFRPLPPFQEKYRHR